MAQLKRYKPEALPPYADVSALLRQSAELLRVPNRMKVSEAAEDFRYVRNPAGGYTGPWRGATTPYLIEPADMQTSRQHSAVIFVGPAQCGKTDGLIINPIVHAVACDPADMMIVQTNQDLARDFSRRRIDRMNRDCREVGERLLGSDTVLTKQYRGMMLTLGFPAITQLSGRPIPRMYITDVDRMPDDIGGEGSVFDLAIKRTQTFGSRAMTVAESSPGKPLQNSRWSPTTPHEAAPAGGILALYNRGDRRRWQWPCPHCGEYFEGNFKSLDWDRDAAEARDHAAAADSVTMTCPTNGCIIEPRHRAGMNAVGVWCPDGQTVTPDGLLEGAPRRSAFASYWLKGPAAAFQTWAELVRKYLDAKLEYERTGDEQALKVTVNTDQAEAFLPNAAQAGESVAVADLIARAEPYPLRLVPRGARFLTQSIDVQAHSFEVLVRAWGVGLESWVVDRFKVFKAAGEDRPVSPGSRTEDWLLLQPLLEASYPLAGESENAMPIARTVIDSGGSHGMTRNAYWFYRRMAARGLPHKLALSKGTGSRGAARFRLTYPDSQRKDRKAGARGEVPVYLFQADTLKDELDGQLRREEPGDLFVHFSRELLAEAPPHTFFEELTAEERQPDGRWKKVAERNEALDLMVMAHVAALTTGADRIDWDDPPAWAADWSVNSLMIDPGDRAAEDETPARPPAARPRRRGFVNNW